MKFSVNKNTLEIVLNHLQPFLDKKDSSQITSHIYLETSNDKLHLKATDYEIGLETQINIEKEIDGKTTVNGKKFLDVIKRLKDDKIFLETDSQNLLISQNTSNQNSKFKLSIFDANEFPKNIQETSQTKINFNTSNFIDFLKKITPAIDNSNQKPELTGALLELKDYSFNFVATDTKRLAFIKEKIQSIENFSLILPKKAINEILKLFSDDIEIFYSQTQLIIKNEYYHFFTKLINGRFPDYERIIPKDFKTIIKLPKDRVIESIKLINSISKKIKILFKNNIILFESISSENFEQANTQFNYDTKIENEISIGITSEHLLDFLSQSQNDTFEICINEANTPFIIRDGNFATLASPIN